MSLDPVHSPISFNMLSVERPVSSPSFTCQHLCVGGGGGERECGVRGGGHARVKCVHMFLPRLTWAMVVSYYILR